MATRDSIAKQRDTATQRLTTAAQNISTRLGVSPPNLTTLDRDRDYLHAVQLTELAAWLEGVAVALPQPINEGTPDGNHTKKANPRSRR